MVVYEVADDGRSCVGLGGSYMRVIGHWVRAPVCRQMHVAGRPVLRPRIRRRVSIVLPVETAA